MTPRSLRIEGTRLAPRLVVTFDYNALHRSTGQKLVEWIKEMPGRRFDSVTKTWVVTAPGRNFPETFEKAGFTVDLFDAPLSLGALYRPVVQLHGPGAVRIFPRFLGPDLIQGRLGGSGSWDERSGSVMAPVLSLAHWPDRLVPEDVREAIVRAQEEAASAPDLSGASRFTALAASSEGVEEHLDLLIEKFGDIPDWFGMTPYPYQRVGALSVAAGRHLLADEPGLGKSLQGIAVAQLLGARRTLVICPPVVQSNWKREFERTGFIEHLDPSAQIAMIKAGRKIPDLPDTGLVIATDSLLAGPSRRPLVEGILSWGGDLMVYDEIHRAKTWDAKRSMVMREIATSFRHRVGLSGTPMMSNPAELASVLAITGQLDPVFGGRKPFMDRYTRLDHFGKPQPRTANLPELGQILRERVWVRRTKAQVLPDLPAKPPPRTQIVDVKLTQYHAAHEDVIDKIVDYIAECFDESESPPSEEEMQAWCSGQIGCISQLRRAAGIAKADAAVEYIVDWVEQSGIDDEGQFARPLIAWGIHNTVINTIAAGLDAKGISYGVIRGDTSMAQRDNIVKQYQDGHLAVILANIVAAGVGITLTRGSDALFVETEWLPDLITQAEDRQHRIGQTRSVLVTFMVADGTLDHTIQRVLRRNLKVLKAVMGEGVRDVSASGDDIASMSVKDIMWGIAEPVLKKYQDRKSLDKAIAARRSREAA